MTDSELVREWTEEEAAEKGVQGGTVAPRVSRGAAASGADHRPGVAPAADDKNPGLSADPPRGPAANAGVTP
jgi:hypothetical protein